MPTVSPETHAATAPAAPSERRILRRAEVERKTGFKRAHIYHLMKTGQFPKALRLGVRETYLNITQTLQGIGEIISGRQNADQMGGPIMMGELAGRVVVLGFVPLLLLIAFISANIGFLNLLPVPVLDGGHLLFYAIEAVRRKPLSQRMQEIGFQIGIALVLMLMVYVNMNDLLRVWRRIMGDG